MLLTKRHFTFDAKKAIPIFGQSQTREQGLKKKAKVL